MFCNIFTGRNEVVAKEMFLQVCVCPQGGCLPQCMLGCHPPRPGRPPCDQADTHPSPNQADPPRDQADPPRTRQTPPDQADPPDQTDPPGTRQTPTPPDQGDPPRTRQTPLGPGRHPPGPGRPPRDQADPPSGKQTPAYGLRAAGTHPTGMHSCYTMFLLNSFATTHFFINVKLICRDSSSGTLQKYSQIAKMRHKCIFLTMIYNRYRKVVQVIGNFHT